jgi:hypothetical protein
MRNKPALNQRFGDSDSFWSQRQEHRAAALTYIILCLSLSKTESMYVDSWVRPAAFLYLLPMPVGFVVSEGPFYRSFLFSKKHMHPVAHQCCDSITLLWHKIKSFCSWSVRVSKLSLWYEHIALSLNPSVLEYFAHTLQVRLFVQIRRRNPYRVWRIPQLFHL